MKTKKFQIETKRSGKGSITLLFKYFGKQYTIIILKKPYEEITKEIQEIFEEIGTYITTERKSDTKNSPLIVKTKAYFHDVRTTKTAYTKLTTFFDNGNIF